MKLTAEQIQENWSRLLKVIEHYFEGDRKDNLLSMYQSLEDKIILAPASGKAHFHNAFPGGYVEHVLRVIECSIKTMKFWESMGANIDFTEQELVFGALNHDLGKIGDGEGIGYLSETSDWHRKNQGSMFKPNPDLDFMLIPDRSLFLLQKYGITMSQKEYLAIRLHDGVYDDANKAYFFSYSPDARFKTNIVYVLHQGDFMASKIEYDRWKNTQPSSSTSKPQKTTTSTGKPTISSEGLLNSIKNM